MQITTLGLGLICLLSSSVTWAESVNTTSQKNIGDNARQWLQIQREGQMASQQPQVISGPVAARIYQRYENSFSHPIPEFFIEPDDSATQR